MSGEPHVRIDRGRLATQFHGQTEHAPTGKPKGLSLSDLQSPAEPAAYLTASDISQGLVGSARSSG